MGIRGAAEYLGRRPTRRGDAERRRRRGRRARRAPDRRADDDVHRLAGAAADDPQHVQDRRRADADGLPRRGAGRRDAGVVDLRRPLRCDGGAHDRIRDAVLELGPGSPRPGARRAECDTCLTHPVRALLRRIPDLARSQQDRNAVGRRRAGDDGRRAGVRAPAPRARSRPPDDPWHGAESRRLLPGPRGGERLLRGCAVGAAAVDGQVCGAHGPAVPRV